MEREMELNPPAAKFTINVETDGDEDRNGADPCSKVYHRHEDRDRDRAVPMQKSSILMSEIQNIACRCRMTENKDMYNFD